MAIANPQSLNGYNYAQDDPTNVIDPSGLTCEWVRHAYGVDDLVHPIAWEYEWVFECRPDGDPYSPGGGNTGGGGGGDPGGGGGGGSPGGGGSTGHSRGQSGSRMPANQSQTQAEKQKEYEECLQNVKQLFDQEHHAIPNVFHNSLPTGQQEKSIVYVSVFTGAVRGPVQAVGTLVVGNSMAWSYNVFKNTLNNAAQRGTLLGEEFNARMACKGFLA